MLILKAYKHGGANDNSRIILVKINKIKKVMVPIVTLGEHRKSWQMS